ncbi:DUF2752 domain-containing protein [Aquimarina aggregata]|uniref:DUF2752 domain-containing protein n=2 Tax=Flavobacteriaceae TaxID=49546 RepID=A0A162FCD0_9FLAO|nr:DUF2752 domain-containing protein [Aquimarina aggregata]KZS41156.1 hypothetical protein AWE51_23695 [Aquimarina aggregata]
MLPCLNKKLFGVDCLGCGMQRSISLLFKGEFIDAFYMYPAIYPLLLSLIFIGFNFFVQFKNDWYIKVTLMILTAVTMIVSYVVKMNLIFN